MTEQERAAIIEAIDHACGTVEVLCAAVRARGGTVPEAIDGAEDGIIALAEAVRR